MIKRLLGATVALAAVSAFTPALAAPSATVTVTGSVTAVCSVANPTQTLDFSVLTLKPDGTLADTSQTAHFGDIWCNGTGNTLSVTGVALTTHNTTADPSFVSKIDFQVTSSNPGLTGHTLDTTSATPISVGGLPAFDTGITNFDQYTVKLLSTGTKKPVAGAYSGEIDVTVTPGS